MVSVGRPGSVDGPLVSWLTGGMGFGIWVCGWENEWTMVGRKIGRWSCKTWVGHGSYRTGVGSGPSIWHGPVNSGTLGRVVSGGGMSRSTSRTSLPVVGAGVNTVVDVAGSTWGPVFGG